MKQEPAVHPIETLYHLIDTFGPLPAGVVAITKHLGGTAFFPGGSGLWGTEAGAPLPPMPIGCVMVVGRNVDSEASFEESYSRAIEHTNGPYWRPLRDLLQRVDISLTSCFFTNVYVGLSKRVTWPQGRFRVSETLISCVAVAHSCWSS